MSVLFSPKLLPCAHCGSTDIRLIRSDCINVDNSSGFCWYVECQDCGIQTETYPEETDNDTDMDDYTFAHVAMDEAIACAVDAWNKRVDYSSFGGYP